MKSILSPRLSGAFYMHSSSIGSSRLLSKPFRLYVALAVLSLLLLCIHASRTLVNPTRLVSAALYHHQSSSSSSKQSWSLSQLTSSVDVDWSRFAYVQYVTNAAYLCNSLMAFASLAELGSRPDRVLLYPDTWSLEANNDTTLEAALLFKARHIYNVTLIPISLQHSSTQEETWADSFTKLLAFNQTRYQRVLSLDSDTTILQHMDDLFLLPSAPVAMPRAYWQPGPALKLTSAMLLVEPSSFEFGRIADKIRNHGPDDFDMEIVNALYSKSCLVIPHRPYLVLTGEFFRRGGRKEKNSKPGSKSQGRRGRGAAGHAAYLGSEEEDWDPEKVLREARMVHFSDWPYPKPWLEAPEWLTARKMPKCRAGKAGREGKSSSSAGSGEPHADDDAHDAGDKVESEEMTDTETDIRASHQKVEITDSPPSRHRSRGIRQVRALIRRQEVAESYDLNNARDDGDNGVQKEDDRYDADCAEQRIWLWLYRDFRERRNAICEISTSPESSAGSPLSSSPPSSNTPNS